MLVYVSSSHKGANRRNHCLQQCMLLMNPCRSIHREWLIDRLIRCGKCGGLERRKCGVLQQYSGERRCHIDPSRRGVSIESVRCQVSVQL